MANQNAERPTGTQINKDEKFGKFDMDKAKGPGATQAEVGKNKADSTTQERGEDYDRKQK